MAELDPLVPLDETFAAHIGLDLSGVEPSEDGSLTVSVPVENHHKQPAGIVHGGVYASFAETLASLATYRVVAPEGMTAMGLANQTSFLRPISSGSINVSARPRHKGRTTWVWDVEFSDDDGRLCAVSRMTIAVRPLPPGA